MEYINEFYLGSCSTFLFLVVLLNHLGINIHYTVKKIGFKYFFGVELIRDISSIKKIICIRLWQANDVNEKILIY